MNVQIVIFRLKSPDSRERFIELTEQICQWLRGQPGFVAYELYEGPGEWSDRIVWESEAHARAGLQSFLETEIAHRMLALVHGDYHSFLGEAVVTR